mgnify:FL=1
MIFRNNPPAGPVEWMVVGLGNPGSQYAQTRHNAGFRTLDAVAEKAGAKVNRLRFQGQTGVGELAGKKVLFLKPSTFMNLSGKSVVPAMQFYKLKPQQVLILFDDISLPCGRLRIRRKGSDGGHNGMKNILYLSGSDQFPRVKMGVGHKPEGWDLADWVLSRFSDAENKALEEAIAHAVEAVSLIVAGDTEEAMNRFNS